MSMIDATELMGTAMRARPTLHSSAAAANAKDDDSDDDSDDDRVAGPTAPTAPALATDAVMCVLRALIA